MTLPYSSVMHPRTGAIINALASAARPYLSRYGTDWRSLVLDAAAIAVMQDCADVFVAVHSTGTFLCEGDVEAFKGRDPGGAATVLAYIRVVVKSDYQCDAEVVEVVRPLD